MADRGNRGGRGGRGGDRGRGGRGRGRGDYDGGGRGRGGSDNRGGRGGGNVVFSGFQGQGRGRGGDGGGRGDRGGFRGGARGGGNVVEIYRLPGTNPVPKPDQQVTQLEDKLLKGLVGDLSSTMARVQLSPTKDVAKNWFPCRPAYGTKGTPVTLWTNYYKVDVKGQMLLKYALKAKRVDKNPSNKKTQGPTGMKLRSILQTALDTVKQNNIYVTDFKQSVYTLKPFTLDKKIVEVHYRDEGKDDKYEVEFNGPTNIDFPSLLEYLQTMRSRTNDTSFPKFTEEINALTVITGFHARRDSNSASLGSRHFPLNLPDQIYELFPESNRLIRGYFLSARPATGRLLLNVNVAHGVFKMKGPATAYIDKINEQQGDRSNAYSIIHKSLSKMRAMVQVLSEDGQEPRIIQKVIHGLADNRLDGTASGHGPRRSQPRDPAHPPKVQELGATAANTRFYISAPAPTGLKGNSYCTVAEYYLRRYKYTVKPNYPVINVGGQANPVYMPAELVEIIDGQPLRRKTTADETRDMIQEACRKPKENASSIAGTGREVLGLNGNDALRIFGVSVGKDLLTVEGRELPPPRICYQGNKTVDVRDGEWNMDKVKFVKPGRPIERWCFINIFEKRRGVGGARDEDVRGAMKNWIAFMKSMGLAIADKPLDARTCGVNINFPLDELRQAFNAIKNHRPDYVFLVLPGKKTDSDVYNAVKTLAELEVHGFGYSTSCVLQRNLLKPGRQEQLFANLGLKVNLKRGGVNHRLAQDLTILKDDTLVVGYDVTHPTNMAGSAEGKPSLVGLVSNIDKDLGQWPATEFRQDGKVEMLDQGLLTKVMTERLQLYYKRNRNVFPKNIIIYRDGVSEGQFQQVLNIEFTAIREACQALYPVDHPPKFCIVTSVKRHQTRFYPTDLKNATRSSNVRPGTVVDRGVTQVVPWDFFLTAHKGIQGTARPAHYTVLYDDIFRHLPPQQGADELQKLTFELCHLFGRATKAVSICPPAYYADILCTRARVHLHDLFDGSDTQSVSTNTTTAEKPREIALHPNVALTMYYM
ncbi:ribonuclease H-like domain-containing protein [Xylariaceae sp. FL0255]|nr:ribonuclease H-like domain-containing protein [Xylariaceae sp. FL0255]